jgi:hypothetical protein
MRPGKKTFGCACATMAILLSLPAGQIQAAPPAVPAAASAPAPSTPVPSSPEAKKGAHDFDFFLGEWKVHNRRLKERLKGSTEWEEFEATDSVIPILDGLGDFDQYRAVFHGKKLEGMTLRLFDPAKGEWSLYWASNQQSVLDKPMVGHFTGGRGEFYADDELAGKPIQVRFLWTDMTQNSAHWEQAFSVDSGKTWETNWTMDMTRVK